MDELIRVFRAVHIAAGVTGLLVFAVPLVVTKGNRVHRRAGWVYVIAMTVAGATAVALAPLRMLTRPPELWGASIFLAYLGVLAFVSSFHGVRVLRQKKRTGPHRDALDWAVSLGLAAATVGILGYGLATGFVLALVFAALGALVAAAHIRSMLRPPAHHAFWLDAHLTSMMIAVIGTLTAFLVNNAAQLFEGGTPVLLWLAPTIVMVPLMRFFRSRHVART